MYVHGFHVYRDIWTLTTGECLSCQTEDSNTFDLYAVAIRKSVNVMDTFGLERFLLRACFLLLNALA